MVKISSKTTPARNNLEDADLPALGGLETQLSKLLPKAVNPAHLIGFGSKTENSGEGTIDCGETIILRVAAVVTQTLPNGDIVIKGRQEVRVNFEMRELLVTGVIRPEDIASENTVTYDKIAEARISYGRRGHISDVQQPRYGQQLFDVVFTFSREPPTRATKNGASNACKRRSPFSVLKSVNLENCIPCKTNLQAIQSFGQLNLTCQA